MTQVDAAGETCCPAEEEREEQLPVVAEGQQPSEGESESESGEEEDEDMEDEDMEEVPTCRICLGESEAGNELFQPCLCTGSMQHVHPSCLHKWRLMQTNPSSYRECPNCKYHYNLKRVLIADFLASPLTSLVVSLVILAICVATCAGFAKYFLAHFFFKRFVWLQAMLVGAFIFGIGAMIIMGAFVPELGLMVVGQLLQAARDIFGEFWSSAQMYSSGDVFAAFKCLALELAKLGIICGGMLIYQKVSGVVKHVLQKMEKLVLGQVQDIRNAKPRAPAPPEASSSSAVGLRIFSSQEDLEEEEEEEDE